MPGSQPFGHTVDWHNTDSMQILAGKLFPFGIGHLLHIAEIGHFAAQDDLRARLEFRRQEVLAEKANRHGARAIRDDHYQVLACPAMDDPCAGDGGYNRRFSVVGQLLDGKQLGVVAILTGQVEQQIANCEDIHLRKQFRKFLADALDFCRWRVQIALRVCDVVFCRPSAPPRRTLETGHGGQIEPGRFWTSGEIFVISRAVVGVGALLSARSRRARPAAVGVVTPLLTPFRRRDRLFALWQLLLPLRNSITVRFWRRRAVGRSIQNIFDLDDSLVFVRQGLISAQDVDDFIDQDVLLRATCLLPRLRLPR